MLTWRVQVDSPVDLDQVHVDAAGLLHRGRRAWTGSTDDNGNPLIDVFPPYDVDMYPVDD